MGDFGTDIAKDGICSGVTVTACNHGRIAIAQEGDFIWVSHDQARELCKAIRLLLGDEE